MTLQVTPCTRQQKKFSEGSTADGRLPLSVPEPVQQGSRLRHHHRHVVLAAAQTAATRGADVGDADGIVGVSFSCADIVKSPKEPTAAAPARASAPLATAPARTASLVRPYPSGASRRLAGATQRNPPLTTAKGDAGSMQARPATVRPPCLCQLAGRAAAPPYLRCHKRKVDVVSADTWASAPRPRPADRATH